MKNPIVISILLLCAGFSAHATTYYVSSISGNDSYSPAQATNPATPWRSMGKVNSFWGSLNPGDTVKLQCGSVFTSGLNVWKSGTAAKPIVVTTYGSGNAPLVTGFTALSGWSGGSGNIWQATCSNCGLSANIAMIGDSSQPMGRWPNSWSNPDGGYAQIQSYNGVVSITDSHIGASGHNWTGANLVIRKNRWVIETEQITSQSGNTITYKSASTWLPSNKFGYFIQGNAYTLDKAGEWYYNPSNKVVQVYSAGNPSSMNMQIARIDTLLKFNSAQYVVINGITFQGANKSGVSMFRSYFITLSNCTISYSGVDAIDITTCGNLNINNVTMDYSNNNGVMAYCDNSTIQNCTIRRTAAFPGMTLPVNSGMGIYLLGNSNNILYNTIDTTGYSGIEFQGNSNTVANNLVNYFCFVKDDGGGIYTWNGNQDSTTSHNTGVIKNNIVINGITAPAGTDSSVAGIAHGIYLDENTTQCTVTGNTVAHCTAGVFFQDARNCTIQNNTLFDCIGQLVMRHALATGTFYGNDVSNNYCVTRVDTQYIVEVSSIGPVSRLSSYSSQHNNHYAQLASGSYFYLMAMTDYYGTGTFGAWQSTYKKDQMYSNLLPLTFPPYTVNSYIGGNMYTKGNIITPFLDALLGVRVISSAGVGAVDSGYYYVLNYTMAAPDNQHTMLNFLEGSASPYPQLTPVINTATATPSLNNSVVWQAKATSSSALLVFQINSNVPALAVSNISLYRANVTLNNPANDYIFQYNPSKSAMTLALSGTWEDAAGVSYSRSVSVPAYGSVILFKKS
ncbi:MAG TPA: right-handed parallel beta-helix repeat-containing protein [Puia sp.]|jgi:parallel beta-helix repeat protein|nr:right-handed parallel beta-helix repeat-containing protein [Puia sp.]